MALLGASLRDLTDARALDVSIVDATGAQVTTFTSPMATPSSTGTITSVASSATDTTLLASNASRKKFSIFNDSTKILRVAFDGVASATNFSLIIAAGGYYESHTNDYTGIIHGIWASAAGFARVTEYT